MSTLRARIKALEAAHQRIVDVANESGATELTMGCARVSLQALGDIADARLGFAAIDGLRAKLTEVEAERDGLRGEADALSGQVADLMGQCATYMRERDRMRPVVNAAVRQVKSHRHHTIGALVTAIDNYVDAIEKEGA